VLRHANCKTRDCPAISQAMFDASGRYVEKERDLASLHTDRGRPGLSCCLSRTGVGLTIPNSEDHRGTPEYSGRVATLIERSFWESLDDPVSAKQAILL
jgi:hypothetical protein